MKIEQITNMIKLQKFTCCEIFDNKNRQVSELGYDTETEANLIIQLNGFTENMPTGLYLIKFKNKKMSPKSFDFDFENINKNDTPAIVLNSVPETKQDTFDISEIENKIYLRLKKEYEENEKRKVLNDSIIEYKKKHSDLENWGGRLTVIVDLLGNHLMNKFSAIVPALNNSQPALNGIKENNSTIEQKNDIMNDNEKQQVNEALNILLEIFNPEEFLQVANLLQNNTGYQTMIKSQLK